MTLIRGKQKNFFLDPFQGLETSQNERKNEANFEFMKV